MSYGGMALPSHRGGVGLRSPEPAKKLLPDAEPSNRRHPNASENLFNVCGGSIDSYLAVCSIQRPNPYTLAERSTASLSGLEARFRHAVTEARAGPAN